MIKYYSTKENWFNSKR